MMQEVTEVLRAARRVYMMHFLLVLPSLCIYPVFIEVLGPMRGGAAGVVAAAVHTRVCLAAEEWAVGLVVRSRPKADVQVGRMTLRKLYEEALLAGPADPFLTNLWIRFWFGGGYRVPPIATIWFVLVSIFVARIR